MFEASSSTVASSAPPATENNNSAVSAAAAAVDVTVFSREDERRLDSLRKLRDNGLLTPGEEEEFAILESKYEYFVQEGIRRLQEGASVERRATSAAVQPPTATSSSASWVDTVASVVPSAESVGTVAETVGQAASAFGRAAYFWTSLVATAVPAVAKKAGITSQFDHWNFITDRLILGALPVITQIGSSGNHLSQLCSQLAERRQSLDLVVACLDTEEMLGYGVGWVEFARQEHWKKHFPEIEYVYLPMLDGTAEVAMESVRFAVDRLHHVLDEKKSCAYVHCKAGKGRSWMVVICYLATYGGRSFENAEALVCMSRHQVNPSRSQREFARDFCKKFHADEEARRLMMQQEEENVEAE